jgi:hypothetical protein
MVYPEIMLTGRHFAILLTGACSCICQGAPLPWGGIASMTDAQRQGAVFQDDLSVPCPGEVFAALDKACRPNWATLVTPATAPVTTERSQLALSVGVLAANGYIAVKAQDGQQVKNVGRELMAEAKALGVSQSLMGRGNSLMEFADNADWDALADELEATENEIKTTMVGQKDRDLVTLTSAAAWLRGLEVATGVVLANEKLQGAEVLRQPELARELSTRLSALPERMKQGSLVPGVKQALDTVAVLLESEDQTKTRENFQRIHVECAAIVKSILTSATAQASPTPPIPLPSATPNKP